ncbi:phosphatidate cytidylyltransferase [Polluticoccus soli]|uniref:phosphatidate cytidylyltransferase n=1 Tax=Polluticoccus soli TaxID=3034150 RepID=UPI0023E10BD7|nr:phosphatidate cytidylyltransferase [Flavipsychrobacter sp. JY13-12]
MKKLSLASLLLLVVSLTGCQLIGDIFKAGVWAGILLVVVVVGLILFVLRRIF